MRIYSVNIILSLLALIPLSSFAQEAFFAQANCTIVYSLNRSANKYFNDEMAQISTQINRHKIQFVDLNNWRKTPPHLEISGRERHIIRQRYELHKGINQAIVLNKNGTLISRFTGSVTLVNALLDCP